MLGIVFGILSASQITTELAEAKGLPPLYCPGITGVLQVCIDNGFAMSSVAITLSIASLGLVIYHKMPRLRAMEGRKRKLAKKLVIFLIAALPLIYGIYFVIGPFFYFGQFNPPFPFNTEHRYYDSIDTYVYDDSIGATDVALKYPSWHTRSVSLYFGIAAFTWFILKKAERRNTRLKKAITSM